MTLILKHQTAAAFIARFREAYRNSDRERCIQLARFILARIQAGDITDAQCRTAFGLTTTQWNNIKTKMNSWITAQNTVQSAVGE
jgi:hypothetical protein